MKRTFCAIALVSLLVTAWSSAFSPAGAQTEPDYTECERQTSVPADQCYGVAALYVTAGGYAWKRADNWLQFDDVCSWHGVTCEAENVVAVSLVANNLVGTIPPDLEALQSLESLDLSGNVLAGTIPTELGALGSLGYLDLSNNILSGTIPIELGQLDALHTLLLHTNFFEGSIPAELGGLETLRSLDLSTNVLSGSIPLELAALPVVEFIDLSANDLDGLVPAELAGLDRLYALELADNRLRGEVPAAFVDAESLRALSTGGNDDLAPLSAELVAALAANLTGDDTPPESTPDEVTSTADELAPVDEAAPEALAFTASAVARPNHTLDWLTLGLVTLFGFLFLIGRMTNTYDVD